MAASAWRHYKRTDQEKKQSLLALVADSDDSGRDDDDHHYRENDDNTPSLSMTALAPIHSFTSLDSTIRPLPAVVPVRGRRVPPQPRQRQRPRSASPVPAARQPSPLRHPLALDDDGDGETKQEDKKNDAEDQYLQWMRSSRDISRPGSVSAAELKSRVEQKLDEEDDNLAFVDPAQFGLADVVDDGNPANRLQPVPIPGTGPPGIDALPLHLREEERQSLRKVPWCFLCNYKRKMNDVINHEHFGSSYHRLMVFIDENRHSVYREKFYLEIQRMYNNSCRKVLSDIEDRDRYWSLNEIYNHFEGGHDTSFKNILEVQFSWLYALQRKFKDGAVCFQDTLTGRPVIDLKAAKAFGDLSARVIKVAAQREAYNSKM